jgi:hypothetical protein
MFSLVVLFYHVLPTLEVYQIGCSTSVPPSKNGMVYHDDPQSNLGWFIMINHHIHDLHVCILLGTG